MNPEELRQRLTDFTGSSRWFEDPALPGLTFTEGVKFFLEVTGAVQVLTAAHHSGLPLQEHEPFLCLHFVADGAGQAVCRFEDGNYELVGSQVVPAVKLPTGDWEFWMEKGVLYLPSEH